MQLFRCTCGASLFFDNVRCLQCGRELGFLPDRLTMSALEPADEAEWIGLAAGGRALYRKCANYAEQNVCNWMAPAADASPFCVACRLNDTIPNLGEPKNREYWAKIEAAKRRLVYSLLRLGLPLEKRSDEHPRGLAFAFLASPAADGGSGESARVMTGHANGLITINVAEADEVEREQARRQMHESYRTLLGHFRHEIGHYYWDRLIAGTPFLDRFRESFGDERRDYAEALREHYAGGRTADWQGRYISMYAASHPWEDWAESFAHYLHMTDTLETSHSFGIAATEQADDLIDRQLFGDSAYARGSARSGLFAEMLREWVWLTVAMNSIGRSMGVRDPYPFVLSQGAAQKLRLVHEVIEKNRAR